MPQHAQLCAEQCRLGGLVSSLFSRLESPRPLLVHLSSGCGSIDSKEKKAARSNYGKYAINVGKDGCEHFLLRLRWWSPLGASTRVDDPIHVQIEACDFQHTSIIKKS